MSFVPQAVQTFRTRNTEGISLPMYGMPVAGVALWVVYGLAIGSVPMVLANGITLVLASTIFVLAARSRTVKPAGAVAEPDGSAELVAATA